MRIAAHALRSAGIEEEIENRQRQRAPERYQPAPAHVAGQDDGAERLVIGPANQRAQVIDIRSELPLSPLEAHRSEPAALGVEEAVPTVDDRGTVQRRQDAVEVRGSPRPVACVNRASRQTLL